MNEKGITENNYYPSVLFRLQKNYYSVNCKNVASIIQLPEIELLPDSPKNVLGIFRFQGKVIPVICLRSLFGMQTVEDEQQEFDNMMNARKQDHVVWVKEFAHCANTGDLFTLAKDSTKCALGLWYSRYQPIDGTLKIHLRKMEEPHRKLHAAVEELEYYRANFTGQEFEEKKSILLKQVSSEYMPQVLNVLEGAKEICRTHRRTLLIVIDTGERQVAISVDEVVSVEELTDVASTEEVKELKGNAYIKEIKKSTRMNRLIFMISDEKLAAMAEEYHLDKA